MWILFYIGMLPLKLVHWPFLYLASIRYLEMKVSKFAELLTHPPSQSLCTWRLLQAIDQPPPTLSSRGVLNRRQRELYITAVIYFNIKYSYAANAPKAWLWQISQNPQHPILNRWSPVCQREVIGCQHDLIWMVNVDGAGYWLALWMQVPKL